MHDLLPKTLSDFGDLETPEILKEMRLKNYESRRISKTILLFKALREKQNRAISPEDETVLQSLDRGKFATTEHRLQTIQKAQDHFLQNVKRTLECIEQKEKRHEQALERLSF